MNKRWVAPFTLSLIGSPALALAQEDKPTNPPAPASTAAPAPAEPEAPPSVPPAPLTAQDHAPPAASGQWVYTSQYGWLWMPYGQAYTYVYPDSDVAYTYAYSPAYGWRWLASPWVFGFGPTPYWGVHGRVRFAWYAHPWFHAAFANHRGAYHGRAYHAPSHVGHIGGFRGGGGFHGWGGFHGGGHGHR